MLDDSNADNAFIAMQALIELAGGGVIDWCRRCRRSAKIPPTTRPGVVSGGKQNTSPSNPSGVTIAQDLLDNQLLISSPLSF
jgi:hypothetical protein